jgi:hypothetical protein
MSLIATLAEVIAAMLALAKDLANIRYLYKTSPEEVAVVESNNDVKTTINGQDDRVKIVEARQETMRERIAARLAIIEARRKADK